MLSRFTVAYALLGLWVGIAARESQAAPIALTAGNLTVNVGQNGTLNVTWSST